MKSLACKGSVSMTLEELQEEIVADLTTELQGDDDFNASILAVKVKNAIKEIKSARMYPSSYTDEKIIKDLSNNYYSSIINLARYDYNQVGVEGQSAYSEGDTSRTWVDRNSLFNGIAPFVKIL